MNTSHLNPAEFFLVVNPGLENLAVEELNEKWHLLSQKCPELFSGKPIVVPHIGGLSLEVNETAGWMLNYYLKIPTRILQRLGGFKAKDFPRFYNRLRRLPWHKFFRRGPITVKVASSQSRLKIKDRLESIALEAIEDSQKHQDFRKPYLSVPQTVYLRIMEDEVSVSVDTSGEALYLRGYKSFSVEAPVRETLAAALYTLTLKTLQQQPSAILDPMCGSGTLIFEAKSYWRTTRGRHFSFQNFPSSMNISPVNINDDHADRIIAGTGWDLQPQALEASLKNAELFNKRFGDTAEFLAMDAATGSLESPGRPFMVLVNPPYNERLSARKGDVEAILGQMIKNVQPNAIGIFWPASGELPLKDLITWQDHIFTKNGGLEVIMAAGLLK